jgi:hypothetical protein
MQVLDGLFHVQLTVHQDVVNRHGDSSFPGSDRVYRKWQIGNRKSQIHNPDSRLTTPLNMLPFGHM